MSRYFRKIVSLMLVTFTLSAVFLCGTLTAAAEEKPPYIASGKCGSADINDIEYYVFDDGSIAFFLAGTNGVIRDYYPSGTNPTAPWYDLGSQAVMASFQSTKIAIESGITAIGAYDFYLPSELTGMLKPILRTGSIDLPDSLTTIGEHAFENQIKLEKITFPKNLTTIGTDAFKGCTLLYGIDYYGDPSHLAWTVGTPFSQNVTLHIKPEYADQLNTLNQQYQPYNITVEANLHSTIQGDGIERNINISMGQENSGVFGGAAPFVIVGTFSGQKKSVTYGNNGFATAVRIGTQASGYQYYIHENNNSKNLYAVVVNSGAGFVESLDSSNPCALKLELSHEYIGKNIVKVKYKLTNPTNATIDNIQLGSAGDVKIGADDYASIKPLTDDHNDQVGFYMTSSKEYDTVGTNSATLGFIGKGVEGSYESATYFYGPVFANANQSSAGAFRHRLFANRIFDPGTGAIDSGELEQTNGKYPDSGMSYFWNVGSLAPSESRDYAVLFSVYGSEDSNNGHEMVEEIDKTYYTVTWDYNFDGDNNAATNPDDSYKVLVENGTDIPMYAAEAPKKPRTISMDYTFDKWVLTSGNIPTCTGDTTFYAVYTEKPEIFFKGHSLTLRGDIGIYFYVKVEGAGITPQSIMNGTNSIDFAFSWNTTPAPYTNLSVDNMTLDKAYYEAHPECYDNVPTSDTYGLFKIKCNTAVAEMSCIVHASAIVTDSSNSVIYTDSDDYCVRNYALTIIGDSVKYGTKLVDLAKAMLDYGAKAQVVFGIATDSPANDGVSYTMQNVTPEMIETAITAANPAPNQSQSTMTTNTDIFGCQYVGSTVVFLTKTSLRHYYTVDNQTDYNNNKNSTGNFVLHEEKAPYMYFELSDIPAKEMDELQLFSIANQKYYYSALDYSKNILRNSNADTATKNLAKATYWYNHYANLYYET